MDMLSDVYVIESEFASKEVISFYIEGVTDEKDITVLVKVRSNCPITTFYEVMDAT